VSLHPIEEKVHKVVIPNPFQLFKELLHKHNFAKQYPTDSS